MHYQIGAVHQKANLDSLIYFIYELFDIVKLKN